MSKKKTSLNGRVREALVRTGKSKYRISVELDIPDVTVGRFINGTHQGTITHLEKYLDYIGAEIIIPSEKKGK